MNRTSFLAVLLAFVFALPRAVPAVEEAPMPGKRVHTMHFQLDATELDGPGAAVLAMAAADYAAAKPARVIVVGYAAPDEGGMRKGAPYAQALSQRRAGSARDYLYKHGIPLSRITTRGRGLAIPAEGDAPAARRCVEIYFE
jgi:outer membrane protein OmpA-like peptidoglycan-associated protein